MSPVNLPPDRFFAHPHGLRDHGEFVPKSRLLPLQRKIDELERALGRKALEVDILKKVCELKELRLPEGI